MPLWESRDGAGLHITDKELGYMNRGPFVMSVCPT